MACIKTKDEYRTDVARTVLHLLSKRGQVLDRETSSYLLSQIACANDAWVAKADYFGGGVPHDALLVARQVYADPDAFWKQLCIECALPPDTIRVDGLALELGQWEEVANDYPGLLHETKQFFNPQPSG